VSAIPESNVPGDTREKTTLSKTESHTDNEETFEVFDQTHQSHANTPGNHDNAKPERRARTLHHDVARNLRGDVPREEDSKGDIVVEALHLEVLLEAGKTSVTDVRAIKEGEEVEEGKEWHNVPIHFTEELCSASTVESGSRELFVAMALLGLLQRILGVLAGLGFKE